MGFECISVIGTRRRSDGPRGSLFLSCCAATVAPTVVQAMSYGRGVCFFAFLHRTCLCSASAELFASEKEIINPSTGKPLAFVCNRCTHAFLSPSSATEAYLASISHHPLELSAHSVAATLRKSKRRPPFGVHASGVLLGLCSGCVAAVRRKPTAVRVLENCKSLLHKEGAMGAATYVPSPAAMPWLWSGADAANEAAAKPNERRKVCAACRSKADRSRWASTPPLPAPSPDEGAVGLNLLSAVAAFVQDSSIAPPRDGAPAAADDEPGQAAALEPSSPSPTVALETLLARYDTLSKSEVALSAALMAKHLRAVRPTHISISFGNGVNRRYEPVPTRKRKRAVQARQTRRRVSAVARAAGGAVDAAAPATRRANLDIRRAAQRQEGVSVVPTGRLQRLSPREQALFMTKHQLSQTKWSELRKALSGKDSGLASREVIRSAMRTAAAEPGRQVWTDARGAHLVSLRDAVECTLDELVQSEQFRERYARGPDGRPVPHTSTYLPTPELPYEQHADNVADIHLCLGLDKGGRGTSTAKLVATTPNQVHPMSRSHSILLSTMPCSSDTNTDLHEMIGPWMGDVQALLESGVTVNGSLRAVRLFLTGDLQFLSCFLGHKGASCRLPCVWCLVVGRRGDANVEALAAFGDIQDAWQKPKRLRTRKQLQDAIEALGEDCNDDLLIPLTPLKHLSIEYPPLFDVEPCQIVVAPLHLTLGVTAILLRLGVEAAALCGGLPAARRAAAAIGAALLKDVRVRPVPYHGGGFAGRECHRIAVRGSMVCDALEGLIPAPQLAALRTA